MGDQFAIKQVLRRTEPPADALVVQPSLVVGAADDRFEREAEALADEVVCSLRTPGQRSSIAVRATRIQRASTGTAPIDDDVERRLVRPPSGSRIARSVRADLEASMGADLGAVRLHHGRVSTELNDRLQARAFTVGSDIYFRDGLPDTGRADGLHLLAHEVTHTLQQGGAVQRIPASTRVQRFRKAAAGGSISDTRELHIYSDRKQLRMTKPLLAASNQALAAQHALIRLNVWDDRGSVVVVEPAIDPGAVLNRARQGEWTRLRAKQGRSGYRSFADCFRTSATVSGIDASGLDATELALTTGTIPIMTKLQALALDVDSALAARAAATFFFFFALPDFLAFRNGAPPADWATSPVRTSLEAFGRLTGLAKAKGCATTYKAILADPASKSAFAARYGINEAMTPQVGTALAQVNDPDEKAAATTSKWNFHWAGVVARSGSDYVTLENLACEIDDATVEEIQANSDIVDTNAAGRFMKSQRFTKQDLINDRWFFKMYGPQDQSFHDKNLAEAGATPSAVSLPVRKT